MPDFLEILEEMLIYLGYVLLFYIAYLFSRFLTNNTETGKVKIVLICIGICIVFSYLRTHLIEHSADDTIESITRIEPSKKFYEQIIISGLMLLIPFSIGFFSKKKF